MQNKNIAPEEQLSYDKAVAAECPIEPLMDRVVVIRIREEGIDATHKMKGKLIVPREYEEGIRPNPVSKVYIKAVGPKSDGKESLMKEGDLVYTFPAVFETMIPNGDVDLFIFHERNIVAKIKE